MIDALKPYLGAKQAKPQPHPPLATLEAILDPIHCGQDLAKHQRAFEPDTRAWVFEDVETWMGLPPGHARRRVFWLKGTGGLGKSVIAAQLVRRYGTSEDDVGRDTGVGTGPNIAAYFFCKHDDTKRNDPRSALATLTFRLAARFPALETELMVRRLFYFPCAFSHWPKSYFIDRVLPLLFNRRSSSTRAKVPPSERCLRARAPLKISTRSCLPLR